MNKAYLPVGCPVGLKTPMSGYRVHMALNDAARDYANMKAQKPASVQWSVLAIELRGTQAWR